MTDLLIIIHFLALAGGLGSSIYGRVVLAYGKGLPQEQRKFIRPLAPRIGAVGRFSLILLWLSGLGLVGTRYGFDPRAFDLYFWLKLVAVVALSGVVIRISLAQKSLSAGDQSALATVLSNSRWTGPLAVVAVILAVLAFH